MTITINAADERKCIFISSEKNRTINTLVVKILGDTVLLVYEMQPGPDSPWHKE